METQTLIKNVLFQFQILKSGSFTGNPEPTADAFKQDFIPINDEIIGRLKMDFPDGKFTREFFAGLNTDNEYKQNLFKNHLGVPLKLYSKFDSLDGRSTFHINFESKGLISWKVNFELFSPVYDCYAFNFESNRILYSNLDGSLQYVNMEDVEVVNTGRE